MNELIDQGLLTLIEGLRNEISILFGEFVGHAQALAAIFMFCYFGVESYKMMVGDKRIEIVRLLSPFALGLVLMLWIPFLNLIDYPARILTSQSKHMFMEQIDEVEMLSRNRYALIDSVSNELIRTSLEVERAEEETREKKWYEFNIDFSSIGDKIAGLWLYVVAKIKFVAFQIIEFVVVTIWQVCTYLVMFLQVIFVGVLAILGPLAFAFSILPAFRDAYIHWIARYISVSLYSCIAYLVLSISLAIMTYGLKSEIEILEYVLANQLAFVMYVSMSSGGVNLFIITCLIGAIAMLTIPFISTWIINTSGVGHAIAGMAGGGVAAVKAVGGAASGGSSGG